MLKKGHLNVLENLHSDYDIQITVASPFFQIQIGKKKTHNPPILYN